MLLLLGRLYRLPGLTCLAIQPRVVRDLAPAALGEGRALSCHDLLGSLLVPGAGEESLQKPGLRCVLAGAGLLSAAAISSGVDLKAPRLALPIRLMAS